MNTQYPSERSSNQLLTIDCPKPITRSYIKCMLSSKLLELFYQPVLGRTAFLNVLFLSYVIWSEFKTMINFSPLQWSDSL